MKKTETLKAIDKYFANVSPDDVVSKLENLGCEFEDNQFFKLPDPPHFIDHRVKPLEFNSSPKIASTDFLIDTMDKYSSHNKNYGEMMIAA